MKKFTFVFVGLLFISVAGTNTAYSFSITKPVNSLEQFRLTKASEFINLSFKEFVDITGQKKNLWNRISFHIMKSKIRRDLKTNPDLSLNDYIFKPRRHISTVEWILFGILAFFMILLLVLGVALKK